MGLHLYVWRERPYRRSALRCSAGTRPWRISTRERRVEWAVSKLSNDNIFVILTRGDGWFVQAP